MLLCLLPASIAHATVFSQLAGIVHDPQHRPLPGAHIILTAAHSDFSQSADSNSEGAFALLNVPLGDYTITITHTGFETLRQPLTLHSDTSPILHFMLQLGAVSQSVTVSTDTGLANVDTVTPTTLINRVDIAQTPGADRTNSMAMITDYVPGAYMSHDMLHMRGGHELSWLIDGVQIPNTNIASNVGPQIDPKDIDSLEVERGSYGADLGDRTYGMFNVLPRSGFERNREGELVLTAGNFYQTNDQLSLGNHTGKFAWYTSLGGNRSNLGLQPAIAQPVNDAENGAGGFASLIYNPRPFDQLRLITQVRSDYYQIPKDPSVSDWESQLYDSSGLSDGQREIDSYAAFSWLHTFNPSTVAQTSSFYHYNQANLHSNPNDFPAQTTADETGNYAGLQASVSTVVAKNSLSAGLYGYMQRENDLFGAIVKDGSSPNIPYGQNITLAGVEESFLQDNFKATPWLTLSAGIRQTHFTGDRVEDALYPRVGAAIQIPKLNWVFRGFYGHFYQPPPLTRLNGDQVQILGSLDAGFVPLLGERNEEHQFGVQIPFKGWLLDADTFENRGRNFLDHNNIGESSVFIPITVQGSLVQAWELTLRSPHLGRLGQAHLSYSNQLAQQIGGVTSGLICAGQSALPTDPCYVPQVYVALDHDQRNTLNLGFNGTLPCGVNGSFNLYYGSGFSNGYQDPPSPYSGPYLPSHTTADLAFSKSFAERYTLALNALNVANTRVLLDNSLTFGGFHYNDPRQLYAELRYRFKF